ncbi:MAG: tRNA (adenosine(37)-N6)-threonylcarbamoyltransferase complex transferase subunit TsaD [Verrucomicrobia bacterium]|nr:MAG: tRNA (adenosine(37)-N6)-threonylcarbamoyltransferase complex transferase subunit TsaD [Verrucomicrobiota bacterium]
MAVIAFETSCDETSVAVVHQGRVLSNVVSSQINLHSEYGGVVPELAAREHLRNLVPIARTALREAGFPGSAAGVGTALSPLRPGLPGSAGILPASLCSSRIELDAIAATRGPGLPSALLVGLKAAQALAFVLRRPFLGIHHHEAHLYSPWITGNPPAADFSTFEPNVSLIVSGGHTLLVHVESELRHRVLGSTVDDAAGECFDKAGKLLGLPYPAGPQIDNLAKQGNPKAFDFPRPMLNDPNDDFSFSGLKTSVRYFIRDHPAVLDNPKLLHDICASIQAAIVEVLVTKTIRAASRLGVACVTASGGVTCNSLLRSELAAACHRKALKLRLAEKSLCTDNAAMIAILAERKLLLGQEPTSLDADIQPSWEL